MQIYYIFLKINKQNPDFLYIGNAILKWYKVHGRDLPFRKTKDPYNIWICEIIFQQTRISQGIKHYEAFVERFPDIKSLSEAEQDEVLLYWKGLGYYSRAINIHKAAKQLIEEFGGVFPNNYHEIIKLSGIGKYTASAISSICFDEKRPAVDGNFYRVLSRIFADNYDISQTKAFEYFSELALLMTQNEMGNFNQAIMDLGSEICKPKNPNCEICTVQGNCIAFSLGKTHEFPVKTKKVKVEDLELTYFFVIHKNEFAVQQRGNDFIWKKLYEFPTEISDDLSLKITKEQTISHKLTHKNLKITIKTIEIEFLKDWKSFISKNKYLVMNSETWHEKSFPKPLERFIDDFYK